MAYDRFLIAPINSGLMTNAKNWLIPDDAFEYLENAYTFRGRLRKRFGSQMMGTTPLSTRLRLSLGNNANVAMNLPSGLTQLAIGQMFSLGGDTFSVYQLGAGVATLSTNGAVSAVINSTANPNTVTFTAGALTDVSYYPSNPVMGITQYEEGAINNHPTYAFDVKYAYTFVAGGWVRSGTAVWKGDNTDYFWATNWQGVAGSPVMFVSNFNFTLGIGAPAATDDPIWTFDGTTWTPAAVVTPATNSFYFLPDATKVRAAAAFIQTARIIVAFKDRLVLLNTVENNNSGYSAGPPLVNTGTATQYKNRARWCWKGSPFSLSAWYEPSTRDSAGNIAAGGGYEDASTQEAIVSAEFIKDRLIVGFERSTWELVYTGNDSGPFIWQKLNTELGSMSTFSAVPFDQDILTVGQSGLHGCNGSNVSRIDDKIPDEVFEFRTESNDAQRVAGVRDYYTEMVYWSYVSDSARETQIFPNRVLVYNYKLGSWAINDDCLTTFGYFEQQDDLTWASSDPVTWDTFQGSWESNVSQSNQRQILAGTPEGFVLKISPDSPRNAPSMAITKMTFDGVGFITLTIMNHNLNDTSTQDDEDYDFVLLENIVADATTMATLNGKIFRVYQIPSADSANNIVINTNDRNEDGLGFDPLYSGTYLGSGTCARVSNVQITTKNFNPYAGKADNVFVAKVDFAVGSTTAGAITVDYRTSSNKLLMIGQAQYTGAIMGNNVLHTSPYNPVLYPFEQESDLLWHTVYFGSGGNFLQMVMYFTDAQMITPEVSLESLEIQAMCLYTQPIGRLQ